MTNENQNNIPFQNNGTVNSSNKMEQLGKDTVPTTIQTKNDSVVDDSNYIQCSGTLIVYIIKYLINNNIIQEKKEVQKLKIFCECLLDIRSKEILWYCYNNHISFIRPMKEFLGIGSTEGLSNRLKKLISIGLLEKIKKNENITETEAIIECLQDDKDIYYGQLGTYGYCLTQLGRDLMRVKPSLFRNDLDFSFFEKLTDSHEHFMAAIERLNEKKIAETKENNSKEDDNKIRCANCGQILIDIIDDPTKYKIVSPPDEEVKFYCCKNNPDCLAGAYRKYTQWKKAHEAVDLREENEELEKSLQMARLMRDNILHRLD